MIKYVLVTQRVRVLVSSEKQIWQMDNINYLLRRIIYEMCCGYKFLNFLNYAFDCRLYDIQQALQWIMNK